MSTLPPSFIASIRLTQRIAAQVASEEGLTIPPVPASTWLGAVLLDLSGLDPQSLRSGTCCILTGVTDLVTPVAEAIRAAVPECVGEGRAASRTGLVVAEDGLGMPEWYAVALKRGRPIVAVTATGDGMQPQEAVLLASREVEIPPSPRGWILGAVVEAATGNRIHVRDEDAALIRWDDVVLVIQAGDDHVAAAERIRRLARQRRERPAKGPGPRTKGGLASPAAPPASDGVVRRLADMPGFGPEARAWGLALAADMQAYRAGTLPWRDVDRGVLLSGPPGCGKTTFARALAMECECELVSTTYGDWHATAGGGGDQTQKHLTKMFTEWRKKSEAGPLIVFMDEIDSIGKRGGSANGDYWFGPIINSWLAFLDGAAPRDGIVVIAATNAPDAVDPALLRPGRLDRHVPMPAPGPDALAGVLRTHLGPEADLDGLDAAARACRGMSPADIGLVVRDARRLARTTFKRAVAADDVRLVLDTHRMREGAGRDLDHRIAVHEAGHAVAILHLGVDTLDRVDLDAALTWTTGREVWTKSDAEARLAMLMAGMTAEDLLLGAHSGGCSRDLMDATNIAASVQSAWGMGASGVLALPSDLALREPRTRTAIEAMLAAAHARARALVEQHRDAIVRVADALVRQRYMDADEVRAVLAEAAPEMEGAR